MPTISLKRRLFARFDLRRDQADHAEIDASFREAVEFRGTNLWVLIFAIYIASIGLNVNSAAVVIGAMLISPLMGPIMGVGYGTGVNDSALVRSSLFNLFIAALISLITSTAYFWVTPLTQAHSELLARTTPTIWDVLIAFFGGLAGAIGITRRAKSNLIPGVAIATALMPPLCTAGYGLATGNLAYFGGAFYLFSINCVFIGYATLLMVKVLRIPMVADIHHRSLAKRRAILGFVVLLTLVPSVYLGVNLVQKEVFSVKVDRFVASTLGTKHDILVVGKEINFDSRSLRVNLVGKRLSSQEVTAAEKELADFGLGGVKLTLVQSGQDVLDMNIVKKDLLAELFQSSRNIATQKDAEIAQLSKQLEILQTEKSSQIPLEALFREISTQFPQALRLSVSTGWASEPLAKSQDASSGALTTTTDIPKRTSLVVQLDLPQALSEDEQRRMRQGWLVRAGLHNVQDVQLLLKVVAPVKSKRRK